MDRGLRRDDGGRSRQSGYLLLPVAITIALIGVIAFLISRQSAIEVDLTAGELNTARAEYVAQAGLQHALRHHAQQGCGPYTDLVDYPFGTDEYDTQLSHDLGATTSYSVDTSDDAWIASSAPTQNKGSDAALPVRLDAGDVDRAVYRFDLSTLPPKATILSATAWLYVVKQHPGGPVTIHPLEASWTEADATWETLGDTMDAAVIATIPPQNEQDVWVAVNLTAQVQAWVNGESNNGIALNSDTDGSVGEYSSKEHGSAPYLEVIVGTPPTSPVKLKSISKLDGGGAASIRRDDVMLRQAPVSMRLLQPGPADAKDSYLYEWKPTWNFGVSNDIWVDDRVSDSTAHGLIRFDLGEIPAGASIIDARLELYRVNPSLGGGPIGVYAIGAVWDEGTKSGGIGESSWNQRDASNAWTNAGGDFGSRRYALQTAPAGLGWSAWEIGDLVDAWVSGALPNQGLALLPETAGAAAHFASSDASDPTLWPKLSVTYTCICGEVCVAPQGAGNILMVVINPTTLVAEDQKAKDLFESWGYTVNVLSESANQSAFDSQFAVNDVVFVSETVNSNQVGIKLADAPIGVVSQDGDYNPDLGISSSSSWSVDSAIDVTSTDHYITRPFAIGALEIYANGMEQLTVSGLEAADLQTLAESSGDGSLVVLDTGDALGGNKTGETAAGRRVMLPLGREGSFVWDQLNSNGRLIVQRALTWGANLKAAPPSTKVLFVVPDATVLGPQDLAKQALMESWNFSVTPFTAASSQAEYDAAVGIHDVAYVSEEILSSDLGTNLRNAAIGVVSEETALPDEFGISSTRTGYTGTDINIVDTSHYITSVFTSGILTIATSATGLNRLGGTLAPGMDALALTAGAPELAAIDTGGQLHDTGNAAGRRVQLPWGTNDFDINLLTTDGETLMRRAIEWGAGIDIVVKSFKVLFVVGNVGGPGMTVEEIAHQSLIESWGHTVEIIDDGASQGDFDTAVANNDVVFITNDITASTLGTKLVNATIGVVTSEDNLSDEFGLASAIAWESGTLVEINDNTHYITSPFPTGTLTILTASESLAYVTGTLSPDLGLLASSASGYGIVTLETGDALFGGGSAAGRRAQLPWGGNGFDPGNLNADGLEILKRALEWGAGAGADTGPVAHWKLDETSGFNAVDSAGDNDGTLIGGNDWTPALIDGGLDLDGSNDYVDAGTFDVTGSGITLLGWFNAEVLATDDGRIVSKASGANEADAYWQLSSTDSGSNRYLRMRIKAGGTTTTMAAPSVNLSTGQWYFAVGTYDNVSGTMKLYLDGVEVASGAHVVGGALDTNASVPVAIGANGTAERFFNGILDDVRVYDYALPAGEIADLYAANPPPGATSYTELYQPWSATSVDTWQTVDLSAYGVPANAVVEVAVVNSDTGKEHSGGVRAVGSSLERRFLLHEAEGNGVDAVTMHVQADASSQIQHYSAKTGNLTFVLLGYWTGATYVERFDAFKAGANASWQPHNLGAYGVGANQVAEIALSQTSTSVEWLVGARSVGSILQRRIQLHEAESGGIDMVTLQVASDASEMIEVYAEADSVVDFHLLGYWSTPPGTYTENGGVHGQVSTLLTWETNDLSSFGVPADSVAQFVMTNEAAGAEVHIGVRETGSTLQRVLDLQEAESGGSDAASMHVNVDGSSQVQWYSEYGGGTRYFYPVGWWVLSP